MHVILVTSPPRKKCHVSLCVWWFSFCVLLGFFRVFFFVFFGLWSFVCMLGWLVLIGFILVNKQKTKWPVGTQLPPFKSVRFVFQGSNICIVC